MFELFKKRDFNAYISDTIAFFKVYGKHYFKNYFTINGIFLMVLVALIYFLSKMYFEAIFSRVNNPLMEPNYLVSYFNNNIGLIIGLGTVFLLLTILLSLLTLTYPIVYLKLIEKYNKDSFTTKEIIAELKSNIGRMIIFLLGLTFIIIPLAMIVFIILIFMCFIIIGIPLMFIVIPAFMSWLTLSYYEFIIKKESFFGALGNGIGMLRQQFWPIIGTTVVMAIMIQIIQGFITLIPYMINMVWMLVSVRGFGDRASHQDTLSTFSVVMAIIMIFSVLLNYFFNNFLIINQGLIYYSQREENEETKTINNIDLIGTDSE